LRRPSRKSGTAVDLSHHGWEDWLTLALFWVLVTCVFLQFFTRYALNNSLAWTEEIAINVLVVVVFMGAAMCVRTSRHIHVDVLYHYLPPGAGQYLSLAVDLIRAGFFVYASWLMWRYVSIVADERMATVKLPRHWFFYLVFAAFVLMLLRSLQVLVQNYRRGYSVLEHPEKFDSPGA
jgi:TRAP-type C4-dicarboxylate transport system permease small subunit